MQLRKIHRSCRLLGNDYTKREKDYAQETRGWIRSLYIASVEHGLNELLLNVILNKKGVANPKWCFIRSTKEVLLIISEIIHLKRIAKVRDVNVFISFQCRWKALLRHQYNFKTIRMLKCNINLLSFSLHYGLSWELYFTFLKKHIIYATLL